MQRNQIQMNRNILDPCALHPTPAQQPTQQLSGKIVDIKVNTNPDKLSTLYLNANSSFNLKTERNNKKYKTLFEQNNIIFVQISKRSTMSSFWRQSRTARGDQNRLCRANT